MRRSKMTNVKVLGALAISAALVVATPAMAQRAGFHGGGVGGFHGGFHGGGMHAFGSPRSGGISSFHSSATSPSSFRSAAIGNNFRNAQASVAAPRTANGFAGRGQVANGYGHGWRRHYRSGIGFGAGLAAGAALGYGYGPYYDGYYGDDYAYSDYYDNNNSDYVVSNADDSASCAQRYKSYDPASGTFLGYDGERHPCP
jgi:hypothetical protein